MHEIAQALRADMATFESELLEKAKKSGASRYTHEEGQSSEQTALGSFFSEDLLNLRSNPNSGIARLVDVLTDKVRRVGRPFTAARDSSVPFEIQLADESQSILQQVDAVIYARMADGSQALRFGSEVADEHLELKVQPDDAIIFSLEKGDDVVTISSESEDPAMLALTMRDMLSVARDQLSKEVDVRFRQIG